MNKPIISFANNLFMLSLHISITFSVNDCSKLHLLGYVNAKRCYKNIFEVECEKQLDLENWVIICCLFIFARYGSWD